MPVEIYIDAVEGIGFYTVRGRAGLDEVLEAVDRIGELPDFRANMNRIFDISKGQVDFSVEDVKRIVDHVQARAQVLGDAYRLAVVSPRDADYGQARMYAAFFQTGSSHTDVRVFREYDRAVRWVSQRGR